MLSLNQHAMVKNVEKLTSRQFDTYDAANAFVMDLNNTLSEVRPQQGTIRVYERLPPHHAQAQDRTTEQGKWNT